MKIQNTFFSTLALAICFLSISSSAHAVVRDEKFIATTYAPTSVTTSSAVFSGKSDTNQTSYLGMQEFFEYGTSSTALTAIVPVQVTHSNNSVSSAVSGLAPATTYYVRYGFSIPSEGTTYGATLAFTTTGAAPIVVTAPTVTTQSWSNITTSTTTVSGFVVVHGAPVTRWFEYGTFSGSLFSTVYLTGTQSADGTFTYMIQGLQHNTVYYYRACAQNSAGSNCGSEDHFTTNLMSNGSSSGNNGGYQNTPPFSPIVVPVAVTQCNDGLDNDLDGQIDQYDLGCTDSRDTTEGGVSTPTTTYVSNVTTTKRASSTSAMYGSAKALVLLAIDSTNSTGNQGDVVAYKVSYRNMSGKRLYHATISVSLPNDLAIERLPRGGGASDDQHFMIDLGTVFINEEKTITFDAKVISRFERNNLHRAEAKMMYAFSDQTKGEVMAYENDSLDFYTNNTLGGLALFSGGAGSFLPATFVGWIVLVVLLYVIVFLFMRFMKEKKPKV